MKYKKIPQFSSKLITKLKKEPILFDEFLDELAKNKDRFFNSPELEFELLLTNGLPLEIEDGKVLLKTSQTPIEEQVFCIVDIETNGSNVSKGHQIIEIGAVKFKNGQIQDSFESLVYAKSIPENIQEITNITPNMLENAPVIQSVLKEFKLFLGDDVFVAHDIKFDYNFVSNSFKKYDLGKLENRKLCTIDLARRTIKAERYGLSYLKELLHIDIKDHHRAYSDALSASFILEESFKSLDRTKVKTVEDLIDFSKNAKPVMPKIEVNSGAKKDKEDNV